MAGTLFSTPHNAPLTVLLPAAIERSSRTDVADALRSRDFVSKLLLSCGHIPATFDVTLDDMRTPGTVAGVIGSSGAHCVFNIFEGFSDYSEAEHEFRSLVEELRIPCTGNPSGVLRTCLSKDECARVLKGAGIPVPEGLAIFPGFDPSLLAPLRLPLFVKPLMEDGSVGIDSSSLVTDDADLMDVVSAKLSLFPKGLRVEEFIPGMEYSVSCVGNGPYRVIGVSCIDYANTDGASYLDYDSKWNPRSPLFSLIPQRARGEVAERVALLADAAGHALGCRGYFRVDVRERNGELYIIEVNPNPDASPDGGFFRQCRESGLPDEQVVTTLIELALEGGIQ